MRAQEIVPFDLNVTSAPFQCTPCYRLEWLGVGILIGMWIAVMAWFCYKIYQRDFQNGKIEPVEDFVSEEEAL